MQSPIAPLTSEGSPVQRKFAKRVIDALDDWGVEPHVQLELLGLAPERAFLLARCKAGADVLPAGFDTLFAAVKVLTLNRLVPELQKNLSVHEWMNRPLREIGNQTPAALIAESPMRGLDRIALIVDLLLAND
jgi:hypothetical protein